MEVVGRGDVLPLGSVVRVEGNDALMVVVARGALTEVNGRRGYFDYAAVLYPNGLVDAGHVLFFNRENIAEVVFVGFIDAAEQAFVSKYDELVSEAKYPKLSVPEE